MSETMTLTDFLLARIEQDEAGWQMVEERESGVDVPVTHWYGSRMSSRFLAKCEADRQIVALHHASADHGDRYDPYCVGCWEAGGEDGAPSYPCPTLRILALPYADHPDYRPEWKP